jgi:hypothetical protein
MTHSLITSHTPGGLLQHRMTDPPPLISPLQTSSSNQMDLQHILHFPTPLVTSDATEAGKLSNSIASGDPTAADRRGEGEAIPKPTETPILTSSKSNMSSLMVVGNESKREQYLKKCSIAAPGRSLRLDQLSESTAPMYCNTSVSKHVNSRKCELLFGGTLWVGRFLRIQSQDQRLQKCLFHVFYGAIDPLSMIRYQWPCNSGQNVGRLCQA